MTVSFGSGFFSTVTGHLGMGIQQRFVELLGAACLTLCAVSLAYSKDRQSAVKVVSPDGKNEIAVKLGESGKELSYTVVRTGRTIIEASPIDVRLATGPLSKDVAIEQVDERSVDKTGELPWGKSRRIGDHFREASIQLKSGPGLEWQLDVRAYDDGVAFRYSISSQRQSKDAVIESENTEFRLAGDPTILFMTVDGFHNSHEGLYDRKPLSAAPVNKLMDKPVLALWPNRTAAAITEARLRNFAGMYVERPKGSDANVLRTRLSPLLGKPRAVVEREAPLISPWRVILLSDEAGKLVESNLLLALNEPAEGDFSWVKPGKTTWPWWNGTVEHGPDSTPELNFAINKRYIDFCAQYGIAYHSISSVADSRPWYVQSGPPGFDPRPDTDVTKPRPDVNLPAILAYAKEKGVGIRLWVWWKPLSEKLEEAFATYERWGIKGLMIDFMDRDDQEMVEWQEKCLRVAVQHKLEIQFHGSYKPSGEQRTFPNLFNREGVLNLEYLKWSDLCTPQHNVDVAYTRLLTGQVDYHLGGFRAASRKQFKPRDDRPMVLGTRCQQLALYVVYENPMPMVCDIPSAYEGQPGFDFLVEVPTTWGETRFVAGDAGEYIVVARRKGDAWYMGGITNWSGRSLKLPLSFLGAGKFMAKLYLDSSLDGEKPNELNIETREVIAGDTLNVSLASGGGMAAVIKPK
jgi:alpha-glucosidase